MYIYIVFLHQISHKSFHHFLFCANLTRIGFPFKKGPCSCMHCAYNYIHRHAAFNSGKINNMRVYINTYNRSCSLPLLFCRHIGNINFCILFYFFHSLFPFRVHVYGTVPVTLYFSRSQL